MARSRKASGAASSRGAPVGEPAETAFSATLAFQIGAISWLFGAGLIHAVWTVLHFQGSPAAGVFFLGLAVVQTLAGFVLAVAPGRIACLGTVAVSGVAIFVWAVSRSIGLEALHPKSLGTSDLICTFFELLTIVAVLPMLRTAPVKEGGRPRGYRLFIGSPIYTLVLICMAVVPMATGHGTGPDTGTQHTGTQHTGVQHTDHSH